MTNARSIDHLDTPALNAHERREVTRELLVRMTEEPGSRAELEDRVIRVNLGVAREVARRYEGRGVPADDLEQVAYLGLVKAVRRFDPTRGTDFLSFAVPTIRGEVRRWFRDAGWVVRPPRSVQELQAAITAAQEELHQSLGRSPGAAEVAAHLGVDPESVRDAIAARGCFAPASLDAPRSEASEGPELHERLACVEPGYPTVEARVTLRPLVGELSPRERRILEMRFVHGATQREIGEEIGVTQMQVSRLLSGIFARLRDGLQGGPGATGTQAA